MKYLTQLSILFFAFLFCGCQPINSNGQEDANTHSKLEQNLDEYFNALLALKQFNGVVLVEKNGKEVLKKAYNLSENASDSLYVTTEHQFDLRSVSKLISKYILKRLQDEGKISVDDTIETYLPDFPNGNKITIQHLMDNQSGLPRELYNEDELDIFSMEPAELVALIKKESLEFEPGTETRYSNLGYELLYFIIGKLTGKTFAQHIQEEVFDRLDMQSSGAHFYTDRKQLKKYAFYHTSDDDNNIIQIEHFEKGSKKQAKLFSTVDDVKKLLREFQQDPYNKKLSSSNGIIGHSGGSEGIRSHIETNIHHNYSFIFLSNYDQIPFADIIKSLRKIMEGKPYEIPKKLNRQAIEISENVIKKYVGKYDFKDANHVIIDFKVEDVGMVVYQKGDKLGPIFAENDTLFFWESEGAESIEFKLDKNGNYKVIMDMFGAPWEGTKIE